MELPPVRVADRTREIGLLVEAREDAVAEATRVRNWVHADLVVLLPGYQSVARNLVAVRHRRAIARQLRRSGSVQAGLALDRLARLRELDSEMRALTAKIAVLVGAHPLLGLPGVGVLTAAKLIAETGRRPPVPLARRLRCPRRRRPDPGELGADQPDATEPRRESPAQGLWPNWPRSGSPER